MNNVGHFPQSETAARYVESTKARRDSPRKDSARDENVVQEPGAVEAVADETATRERSLLLATLRVWELKHGIRE